MSREPQKDRGAPAGGSQFRVEDLPRVDVEKLSPVEMATIERAVIDRERLVADLQTNVLEVQSERDALANRLDQLQSERNELQDRIRQLETERPRVAPQAVFSDLGSAIGDVREELAGAAYDIGDVEFSLKANVTQTDEGLRMHLPSIDETFATENLSEIRFSVRSRGAPADQPEREYTEIPDLVGMARDVAERRLRGVGLAVGEVTTVEVPDEEPGTVVDQFPDPFTVAPPESPVDLTVVTEREPSADTGGEERPPAQPVEEPTERPERPSGPDRMAAEVAEAIERTELDAESELATRLREADVTDLAALVEREPAEVADITGVPESEVVPLIENLVERVSAAPERRLEAIDGIGPTYAGRLRAAGVTGVTQLAELDPTEAAEITRASTNRTERWIRQARSIGE